MLKLANVHCLVSTFPQTFGNLSAFKVERNLSWESTKLKIVRFEVLVSGKRLGFNESFINS